MMTLKSQSVRAISNCHALAAWLCSLFLLSTTPALASGVAIQLDLQGALGVATAEYIIDGIKTAEDRNANIVIIRMDTPGGLMEPMRDIIQAILNAKIPVATYVTPEGARADSAGTYILLASHIAAMSPTTHLGAATPVSISGDDADGPAIERPSPLDNPADGDDGADTGDSSTEADETSDGSADDAQQDEPNSAMGRKVLNDAIAYIRGLAESRGRNADWAEKAVRDAATLTAKEALAQNVIDVIADDTASLLAQIDGREVSVNSIDIAIDTSELVVETIEPDWRTKFLNVVANPQIVVLLMAIGVYGLLLEGYNPGAIYPGVAGVISLLLAAYALQVLPVNYVGLALIIVGFVLIALEAFVPSFGALGIGGIVAFVFGAIMMFDSGIPGFGISKIFVVSVAIVTAGLILIMLRLVLKLRRRGPVSGKESIVGSIGKAMESFTGEGKIWLEGEAWAAVSSAPIEENQDVRVRAIDGLTLLIDPADS